MACPLRDADDDGARTLPAWLWARLLRLCRRASASLSILFSTISSRL
jgi:hypothetical protein